MNNSLEFDNLTIVASEKADGDVLVRFSSFSGTGAPKRGRIIDLVLYKEDGQGTTPSVPPQDGPFYVNHGVVVKPSNRSLKVSDYNYLFLLKNPADHKEGFEFISNNYSSSKYETEFNEYMNQYISQENFKIKRFDKRPVIVNQVWPAVLKPGEKSLNEELSVVHGLATGTAITIPDYVSITYPGDLKVGGNFTANGGNVTVNGDMWVKGNLRFDKYYPEGLTVKGDLRVSGDATIDFQMPQLVIEGDLIIGGNLITGGFINAKITGKVLVKGNFTLSNSSTKIHILDDLKVGGNITSSQSINDLSVEGELSCGNSLTLQSVTSLRVGKWNSDETIKGNDSQSLIVGNELIMNNTIDNIFITNNLNVKSFPNQLKNLKNLKLGGSFIAGSNVKLSESINDWQIGGDISITGQLDLVSVNKAIVNGTLYATSGIKFETVQDNSTSYFIIKGSVLSPGIIKFNNTVRKIKIDGDVISQSKIMINSQPINDLTVGGSLVSVGALEIPSSINSLVVGGDIITSDRISFPPTQEDAKILVKGFVVALNNIDFTNTFDHNRVRIELGGFYTGGTMSAPSYYTFSRAKEHFKITHSYSGGGGSSPSVPPKYKISTNWNSRVTYGSP